MARQLISRSPVWIEATGTGGPLATLGERIVKAARLAVAVHLFQDVTQITDQQQRQAHRRRVRIGGAGPSYAAEAYDASDATE